ncbi:hypothetical protein BDP55DRAFT_161143 [Colletotrichum godetiae]|uniref:Uncharacterized protein n=1 Tax=Colletotrichum godetiae TaxID=1209918 RepID=A0AAJ0AJY1_9PEZI|nr:uncharacterized protein BDP55DRAFT_161143 [Colletotrichum godetiae]KAK1675252.1 hypothetical protein BDP55DRAFT_161143 [Colletotrichum godetiae]
MSSESAPSRHAQPTKAIMGLQVPRRQGRYASPSMSWLAGVAGQSRAERYLCYHAPLGQYQGDHGERRTCDHKSPGRKLDERTQNGRGKQEREALRRPTRC